MLIPSRDRRHLTFVFSFAILLSFSTPTNNFVLVLSLLLLSHIVKNTRPPPTKQVYDVSEFFERHPGGRVLLTYAGKDATDVFSAFHAPSTWPLLRPLLVGELVAEDAAPAAGSLLADFRAMRASFAQRGLFRASAPYYCFKVASTLSLAATAIAMLFLSRKSSGGSSPRRSTGPRSPPPRRTAPATTPSAGASWPCSAPSSSRGRCGSAA